MALNRRFSEFDSFPEQTTHQCIDYMPVQMKTPCECVHFILFFLQQAWVFVQENHMNEKSNHSPNIDSFIQSITTHTHTYTHTPFFFCVSIVQDIAQLCQEEKESGNQTSFCLDYLLASTQYDWFVQVLRHTHTHRHTCQICLICQMRQI